MKKILVILLSFVMAQGLKASTFTYPYLTFVMADNTCKTFSVENLTITPDNGTLKITNAEQSETLVTNDIDKMYFSEDVPDAISNVNADAQQDTNSRYDLYTSAGQMIGSFSNISAAHSAMKQGMVYIIKKGNKTVKTIK